MIDDCGETLYFSITHGNVDDRMPVPQMTKNFIGKLFGDKGYVLKNSLNCWRPPAVDNVERITKLKKNMKPKVIALFDKILLRKRSIIETINDQMTK